MAFPSLPDQASAETLCRDKKENIIYVDSSTISNNNAKNLGNNQNQIQKT